MAVKMRGASGKIEHTGGSSAWEDAPTEVTTRKVFMRIVGDTGTGRTKLALTAPGPVAFAHAGEKIEGVLQAAAKQQKIRVMNFGGSFAGTPQDIANQAGPTWNKLVAGAYDAIDNWARTFIIDTDTEAWELLRLARFGEMNPKGRTDFLYGPVNAEWRSLFKRYRGQERCSVIAIGQTKEEYVEKFMQGKKESARTGRTIQAGQKEMGFMADVVIRTSRDIENGDFIATITKGWFNAMTEGVEFRNEEIRFSNIMAMITETEESEWQ